MVLRSFRALALRRNFPIRIIITKLTFRASALRRHFPIRLRSWRFERQTFVATFRLDYEADVASVSPSSSLFSLSLALTIGQRSKCQLCNIFTELIWPLTIRSIPNSRVSSLHRGDTIVSFETKPFVIILLPVSRRTWSDWWKITSKMFGFLFHGCSFSATMTSSVC